MISVVETVYAHANFILTQDNHWNWDIASRLLWFQLKLTQLRRTWLCDGEVHQYPWRVWHSGQHDQVIHLCHDNRSLSQNIMIIKVVVTLLMLVSIASIGSGILFLFFFQAGVLCSIENGKCCGPSWLFCREFVHLCTFTGLDNAVVDKNKVCMVIKGRAQKMIFVGLNHHKSWVPTSRSSTSTQWTTWFQHHHGHQYQRHHGHQYHVQHDQEAGGYQGAQQHWEDQVLAFWVQASTSSGKNIMWSIFLRARTFILLLMQEEKNLSG